MEIVSRDRTVEQLLNAYTANYNIEKKADEHSNLRAVCEYFEHSGQYIISQKTELWSANSEEFIYLFEMERLTLDTFKECCEYALKDGLERAHIGPGHMYSYITPVFVCETCDEDAVAAIKKCKYYRSFKFALHGWVDLHLACVEMSKERILTNASGKCVAKALKKVLS